MNRRTFRGSSLHPLQKTINNHKPVRPYRRFVGVNNVTQVEAAYNEFMKKDVANPLNRRSVDAYKVHNNEHFKGL